MRVCVCKMQYELVLASAVLNAFLSPCPFVSPFHAHLQDCCSAPHFSPSLVLVLK